MKNSWSNIISRKYVKRYKALGISEDVALRVYSTRLLGCNKELVLHGGGNTSVKTIAKDIDAKKYNVLRVKGSGWDMAHIEPEGMPAVKLDPLQKLKNKKFITDEEMVSFQKRHLIDIKSPNPSVETLLHAFLPYKYVDHTHADAILEITNRAEGLNLCKKIFGKKVAFVPYVMPGFLLAKKVNEIFLKNKNINCLILLNHGIFTFGNSAKESYDLMINYVSQAEKFLNGVKRKSIKQIKIKSKYSNYLDVLPIIRGALSRGVNKKFSISYKRTKEIEYFANGEKVSSYSQKGTVTPDHVIRIKPKPLIIYSKNFKSLNELEKAIENGVKNYRKKYQKYFYKNNKNQKKGNKKIMLDTSPRVVFVQGLGMFCAGENLKSSKIAEDLAQNNIKIISSIEENSKFKTISERDLFDMEYWSLEQAKIKKQNKSLAGSVVVITGGAGTIGLATCEVFRKNGAQVVLLDNNKNKIKKLEKSLKDVFCIPCDVTSKKQVKQAFKAICDRYGGLDILLSNAGSAISGSIADTKDNVLRRSFNINFFSHQNCASEATKIMLRQKMGGCLLFNISKQSVNPGKNFGPYGLPKTALMGLCKQYALDYGHAKIRSNGVNADRIKSGLLDNKLIESRAKSRELSVQEYMSGNLLSQEVLAKDVAEAFYHLAISKKTTGAILTVDGGNIPASLR